MEFKNGYNFIYSKLDSDGELKLYATKTGLPGTDDVALTYGTLSQADIKELKLIYVKDDELYGSKTGIPASDDTQIVLSCDGTLVFGAESAEDTSVDESTSEADDASSEEASGTEQAEESASGTADESVTDASDASGVADTEATVSE